MSKGKMENDFRELETVIMNQTKFTELKHYLGPKKIHKSDFEHCSKHSECRCNIMA